MGKRGAAREKGVASWGCGEQPGREGQQQGDALGIRGVWGSEGE